MITCREGSRAAVAARIGDGLAGADLAGDHADGVLVHAPGDPGDGFAVAGVAVQHRRGQAPPERHPGETVMRLQPFDAHADASRSSVDVSASSMSSMDELPGDLALSSASPWSPKRASIADPFDRGGPARGGSARSSPGSRSRSRGGAGSGPVSGRAFGWVWRVMLCGNAFP